ncbi:hypothetical protein Golob_011603 [Gossypium lobatum]|uniref:Uncharacterized protein n=1 Tax=Gossypium lobatum TaxID=34289 RepID=A0A7J8MQF1_9ROSI|nr:hypothetical protein [Gossypium lobatum]
MLEFNSTKRVLKESKKGLCHVTNLVDRCKQCDPDWEKNKKNLADCAPRFARGTTSGKGEQELIVTSDKIIDARRANMKICNAAGITVQFAKNVIIPSLHIHHIIPTK